VCGDVGGWVSTDHNLRDHSDVSVQDVTAVRTGLRQVCVCTGLGPGQPQVLHRLLLRGACELPRVPRHLIRPRTHRRLACFGRVARASTLAVMVCTEFARGRQRQWKHAVGSTASSPRAGCVRSRQPLQLRKRTLIQDPPPHRNRTTASPQHGDVRSAARSTADEWVRVCIVCGWSDASRTSCGTMRRCPSTRTARAC
jgi:hypothetical protein